MRTHRQGAFTRFTFTADDTYTWATRTGAAWPCSALSGRRLSITVDGITPDCDLIDIRIDGHALSPESLYDMENELSAFLTDHANPGA